MIGDLLSSFHRSLPFLLSFQVLELGANEMGNRAKCSLGDGAKCSLGKVKCRIGEVRLAG